MLGRQRPGKLKSRRVVHKSTGGMLNPIPEPVDPVGNAPSSSLNTVAHPRAPGALALSLMKGRGIWKSGEKGKRRGSNGGERVTQGSRGQGEGSEMDTE